MIIQVAGTNGAGKSTVIRAVMAAGSEISVEVDGKPAGHELRLPEVQTLVRIIGPYGSAATGGCDSIKSVLTILERVTWSAAAGYHVIFEGIRALNQTRGPALAEVAIGDGIPYIVLLLTTPLGVSLQSIDTRRAARGDAAFAADTRDIENNHIRARNFAARMRDAGAKVVRASRDEAPAKILDLLRSA